MGKKTKQKYQEFLDAEAALQSTITPRPKKEIPDTAQALITQDIRGLSNFWIRKPGDWTFVGKSKSIDRRRNELIKYLFCRYSVPLFLFKAWSLNQDKQYMEWFAVVGNGKSLYKECLKDFMTKKETHVFLAVKTNHDIKQKLWWAKAYCFAPEKKKLVSMIADSRIVRFPFNDFWVSVMHFFLNHGELIESSHEISDILDCIAAKYDEDNEWTMKGRTYKSVKRMSKEWHKDMANLSRYDQRFWEGMGIKPTIYHGTQIFGVSRVGVTYTIKELTSGFELAKEGNEQRHCVAGYVSSCVSGQSHIFALKKEYMDTKENCVTIEVRNRVVVQTARKANIRPTAFESELIHRWAREKGLTFGHCV